MTPLDRWLKGIPDQAWSLLIWLLAVGLCGVVLVWEWFRLADRIAGRERDYAR